MRFKADHDALTLLLNRGAILTALREACDRVSPEFSVMLCDVDHFKRINDSYGHPVGDEVLREIALRLSNCTREIGKVGRYGGEEFLIIVESADPRSFSESIDRIRDAIRTTPIQTSAGLLTVSLSGGAVQTDRAARRPTAEQILKRADDALYGAKRGGRDQIWTDIQISAVA